jgi:ketosteroid isomerase-like protein
VESSAAVPDQYLTHIRAVTGGDVSALRELWEPDAVIEFPYARSVGSAERLTGIEEIVGYFDKFSALGEFTLSDVHAWQIGPLHWITEAHGSSVIVDTGKPYEQDYVVRFRLSERERLQWWREYWDPTRL